MFLHFYFTKKFDILRKKKEGESLEQEIVRSKLIEKTYAFRQKNIAVSTGIPVEILSKFMNRKRDLYPESLAILNDYLDNH